MKKQSLFLFIFVLLSAMAGAQKITGVRFAYFNPTGEDSTSLTISVGGYNGVTDGESFVSENPKKAAKLIALVKGLKANGTEDINKCFIPRHVVTLLNGNDVVYRVLVCFECDGVRFSNEKTTTKIKSVAKREKLMKELKNYFSMFHFSQAGRIRD